MAQACLTALDTWRGKEWREEQRERREESRRWRRDDMAYRWQERTRKREEHAFREETRRWRTEMLTQRELDNSMFLWKRQKEANRRAVEEKAEHLRALSWVAAIVGGFVFTAPVEFNYAEHSDVPESLLGTYAVTTALVPSFMLIAAMEAVFLLGTILRVGKAFVSEAEEEEFLAHCRVFAAHHRSLQGGDAPPKPKRTFEGFWEGRCEDDWKVSFRFFVLGVTIFFVLLSAMAFIKLFPNVWIPSIFTSICGIACIIWITYYWKWGLYLMAPVTPLSEHRVDFRSSRISGHLRAEPTGTPFDWHIRPSKALADARGFESEDEAARNLPDDEFPMSRGVSLVSDAENRMDAGARLEEGSRKGGGARGEGTGQNGHGELRRSVSLLLDEAEAGVADPGLVLRLAEANASPDRAGGPSGAHLRADSLDSCPPEDGNAHSKAPQRRGMMQNGAGLHSGRGDSSEEGWHNRRAPGSDVGEDWTDDPT